MSHGKVFVKYYFWIVFLCDVSLKYVWFCPGLLYVPCVFWHHRHGGLTWLMQLFFCNVSCSTWLLCNNFLTCCATQGWLGFPPLPIPALLFQPRVRAFCALELLGPSRRQFPGKKNMVKVRESFRNTGSRNYIFNFVEFKYQFSVFGDPEVVVGLGNPFERLNISSSWRWVKRYWIWYSVFYTGIPKLCVRGSVDDQSFLWRKLSFFFRSCGTSG